jgi:uncharacterized protein YcbK (DUF882 family)
MQATRTTVMVLVPGRNAVSLTAPRSAGRALLSALLLPLVTGVGAERCFRALCDRDSSVAIASLSGVAHAAGPVSTRLSAATAYMREALPVIDAPPLLTTRLVATAPQPSAAPEPGDVPSRLSSGVTLSASLGLPSIPTPGVVDVRAILRALSGPRRNMPSDAEVSRVPSNGPLRLEALHLGENLEVRPFDDMYHPNADALSQIDHLMRCRITGHEIGIDPRLVTILVQLHALFGKSIQLVSGHRTPNTIGTKRTSQHTLGRAADIRIPGVSIERLKQAAIKLGARGVGLYPEKGFVHVDVRQKTRYFWSWTAAQGEHGDGQPVRPARIIPVPSEAGGEPEASAEAETAGESADSEDGAE